MIINQTHFKGPADINKKLSFVVVAATFDEVDKSFVASVVIVIVNVVVSTITPDCVTALPLASVTTRPDASVTTTNVRVTTWPLLVNIFLWMRTLNCEITERKRENKMIIIWQCNEN